MSYEFDLESELDDQIFLLDLIRINQDHKDKREVYHPSWKIIIDLMINKHYIIQMSSEFDNTRVALSQYIITDLGRTWLKFNEL